MNSSGHTDHHGDSSEQSHEKSQHAHHSSHHTHHDEQKTNVDAAHVPTNEPFLTIPIVLLLIAAVALVIFNQVQILSLSDAIGKPSPLAGFTGQQVNLAEVKIDDIKNSAGALAAVFPVSQIKTQDDALAVLFPQGTPEYGEQLKVSYDDPVGSLAILANMYRGLKVQVQKENPEAWQRYLALASKPVGISCEYCCGIGPVGINANGDSACGCQHNPALLSVALYLTAYSDYSDAEILQETLKWKTLFFPKDMISLGLKLGGGDTSVLEALPGMVGGC